MAGNPLLSMMGGNNPMNAMMQNNPLMQLVGMLKNGGNPQSLVQQMMENNPQMQQVMQMINGKDQSQVNEMISKTAQEKGIDLSQLASQLGMPKDVASKFGIEMK